jgi:hypothetical protein
LRLAAFRRSGHGTVRIRHERLSAGRSRRLEPRCWLSHPPARARSEQAAALLLALARRPALAKRGKASATSPAPRAYATADSLEGNYLAAYIAGSSRDTTAAAVFYREALKNDPRNPELLERAFVSLLADGDIASAVKAAERITARDGSNGLAQLTSASARSRRASSRPPGPSWSAGDGGGRAI